MEAGSRPARAGRLAPRRRLLAAMAATLGFSPALPATGSPVVPPVVPLITVTVSTDTVPTATFVWITVTLDNIHGGGAYSVEFGDNSPGVRSETFDAPCKSLSVTPTRRSDTYRHSYRTVGRKVITARFTSDCGQAAVTYTGLAVVNVTPGARPANGPEPVTFHTTGQVWLGAGDRRTATTVASFEDYDGWITRVSYRWGDGTPDTVFTFPIADCVDPSDHWPSSRFQDVSDAFSARHTYRRPGRYGVVVTVTSRGCHGGDPQHQHVEVPVAVR